MAQPRQLVLASSSKYRQELLRRFGFEFQCVSPAIDETPLDTEPPARTASRLAESKARAVEHRFADALIVGSDQVASLGSRRLEKPGGFEAARQQLLAASGNTVEFHTAVSLLDTRMPHATQTRIVPCRVRFRSLSLPQIDAYLRREEPYDCAGSAKVEGLGITLIERIETDDPTSLVGLPLIALADLLTLAGMPVLG